MSTELQQNNCKQRLVYKVFKVGKYDGIQMVKDEIQQPKNNSELVIKVKCIGLNFADIFAMLGLYSATPQTPFIPGLEFSGEIYSEPSKESQYKKGDKIFGVTRFGAYSSFLTIDERYIRKLPEQWTLQEGASFLCQTLTAYYGLVTLGNLQKDSTVLIHSGAGGVGLQANRICKQKGAYTIGTVGEGRENKLKVLKQEKFDEQIVRTKDWHTKVQQKPDIVMDATGNQVMKKYYDIMNKSGRLIVYGGADFTPKKDLNIFKLAIPYLFRPKYDPLQMVSENKSIMAFNLIWMWEKLDLFDNMMKDLGDYTQLKAMVGSNYDFTDLKQAMQFFQSGQSTGKVVINVEEKYHDQNFINKFQNKNYKIVDNQQNPNKSRNEFIQKLILLLIIVPLIAIILQNYLN